MISGTNTQLSELLFTNLSSLVPQDQSTPQALERLRRICDGMANAITTWILNVGSNAVVGSVSVNVTGVAATAQGPAPVTGSGVGTITVSNIT